MITRPRRRTRRARPRAAARHRGAAGRRAAGRNGDLDGWSSSLSRIGAALVAMVRPVASATRRRPRGPPRLGPLTPAGRNPEWTSRCELHRCGELGCRVDRAADDTSRCHGGVQLAAPTTAVAVGHPPEGSAARYASGVARRIVHDAQQHVAFARLGFEERRHRACVHVDRSRCRGRAWPPDCAPLRARDAHR